jgi:hypothetical protein
MSFIEALEESDLLEHQITYDYGYLKFPLVGSKKDIDAIILSLKKELLEYKIRTYCRLIYQGSRQHSCLFSKLPNEILLKIACHTIDYCDYQEKLCKQIALRFFERPKMAQQ